MPKRIAGYSKDDNATCCEDCAHFVWPEDDYQECGLGHQPGPFGGWATGKCTDWRANQGQAGEG